MARRRVRVVAALTAPVSRADGRIALLAAAIAATLALSLDLSLPFPGRRECSRYHRGMPLPDVPGTTGARGVARAVAAVNLAAAVAIVVLPATCIGALSPGPPGPARLGPPVCVVTAAIGFLVAAHYLDRACEGDAPRFRSGFAWGVVAGGAALAYAFLTGLWTLTANSGVPDVAEWIDLVLVVALGLLPLTANLAAWLGWSRAWRALEAEPGNASGSPR